MEVRQSLPVRWLLAEEKKALRVTMRVPDGTEDGMTFITNGDKLANTGRR
jgi:hypothetical protein